MTQSQTRSSLLAVLAATTVLLSGCSAFEPVQDAFNQFSLPGSSEPAQEDVKPAEDAAPSALASTQANPADCPSVTVSSDLQVAPQFADITQIGDAGILATTTLSSIDHGCTIEADKVMMDLTLNFEGVLGAAGEKTAGQDAFYSYPYFIAIVDPNGTIVAKDVFAVTMAFKAGQKSIQASESLRQSISLSDKSLPTNKYSLLVGFQLSLQELDYLREKRGNPGKI